MHTKLYNRINSCMCKIACKERYMHGFVDEKLLANINMNTLLYTGIYSCIRDLASANSYKKRLSGIYSFRHTLNTYRTAVSRTLDLLCREDFNVGRSEAESNNEIFMPQ